MGNIKCLNCNREITTISGMECPHCRAQLSHVKIAFLSYLGPEDSLSGYQRSYKLVLLRSIFEALLEKRSLSVRYITEKFGDYYATRKKLNLPTDKDVDLRIQNIESSTERDIWLMIHMNPYAAIAKHGFLRVIGDGLNGEFALQKGIDNFTEEELRNLLVFINKKLELYYRKIGSHTAEWIVAPPVKAPTPPAESVNYDTDEIRVAVRSLFGIKDNTTKPVQPAPASEKVEAPVSDSKVAVQPAQSNPSIVPLFDDQTPIEELSLSNRAFNALKRAHIDTVGQLAKAYNDGSLAEIRNIGKTVIDEISGILNVPIVKKEVADAPWDGCFATTFPQEIAEKRIDELFTGGVMNLFINYCHLAKRYTIQDIAGFEYIELLKIKGLGQKKIAAIIDRCKEIEKLSAVDLVENAPSQEELKRISIHKSNHNLPVATLRLVGATRGPISALINAGIVELGELDGSSHSALEQKIGRQYVAITVKLLSKFSCSTNELIDELIGNAADDKLFEILVKRAEGETLQSIADKYDLTRERVRQICVKALQKLRFPGGIIADCLMAENGGQWFRKEQLQGLLTSYEQIKIFTYLYENSEEYFTSSSSALVLERRAFPDAPHVLTELVADIVGEGINIFKSQEEIEAEFDAAGYGFFTADDFLDLLIEQNYIFYGDYVVKNAKSYGLLCAQLVAEEFPNGINNNEEDLNRLRMLAKDKYGDLDIPESNRSFFSRISTYLVLRGRSQYISPQYIYADESILADIKAYIDSVPQQEVFYSEIFAEHEGLLLMMTNIDNPWFLHGVLMYYYPNEYSYSRDFLRKDTGERTLDLGERIANCLKDTGHAMNRKELLAKFPGISEVMLFNAINNTAGLIQWDYNYYNCIANVSVVETELQQLGDAIDTIFRSNDGYCSEGLLYKAVCSALPDFVARNGNLNSQNLFYTCAELLGERYEFKRPHIATRNRFKTLNVIDIAMDMLGDCRCIKASDYFQITKKLLWPEVTASMAFAEIEKDYIRLNQDEYVSKASFAFTDEDQCFVREYLSDATANEWFLSLQHFADSEDEMPSGRGINEFFIAALVSEFDLGWHVVSPQMRDRRYQRGILVRNDVEIHAYDELVCQVLKEQGITTIQEEDLQGFLQIHSLVYNYMPKELQKSTFLAYNNGVFTIT